MNGTNLAAAMNGLQLLDPKQPQSSLIQEESIHICVCIYIYFFFLYKCRLCPGCYNKILEEDETEEEEEKQVEEGK